MTPRPSRLRDVALLALFGAGCDASPAHARRSTVNDASPSNAPITPTLTLPAPSGATEYLVVLLHGVGADAASFLTVGRALASALPHGEVVVPDGFQAFDGAPSGRQWFSIRGVTEQNRALRVRQAAGEVSAWIDAALAARGLPADRVVLVGFSQGAIVANWLALHRRPAPMAVVSLSGRLADDGPAPGDPAPAPVLLVHGARDGVVPVASADEAARGFQARGARVRVRVFPGLGHNVDDEVILAARAFLLEVLARP